MVAKVASLFGVLSLKDEFSSGLNAASKQASGFGDRLQSIGGGLQSFAASAAIPAAMIGGALAVATRSAISFDTAITNVGAVLGKSSGEMKDMRAELLAIGGDTVQGPQAVAEAFYDIVGGVADASTHMDILKAAISTATAGNADLGGTTAALISVMNSYGFAADKASFASDVLTQTVGMGVGSMDEFAAALPTVTGLANSLGIEFDDLGAMTAYLTTQGNSAAQATTQLSAMMTSMLNPNEAMKKGLEELGFASGQAAIDQLGLVGAFDALGETQVAGEEGMAKMTGSVEALRGVTALTNDAWNTFSTDFVTGVDGATAAAETIQMESAANQFALLQSSMSEVAIEVGTALLPILTDLVAGARPVVEQIIGWIKENPELTKTILAVAGGAAILVPIIGAVGTVIGAAGTIVGVATTAVGLMSGGMMASIAPILAVGAAIAGVIAAVNRFNTVVGESRAAAGNAIADYQAAGNTVGKKELEQRLWNAALAEAGNDAGARVLYSISYAAAQGDPTMGPILNGTRAAGGPVSADGTYLVGEQGPELFVPGSSGTIVPNHAMGGGVQIGNITIQASGAREGRAAGDAFVNRINELMRANG